jgi:hypothetical protein
MIYLDRQQFLFKERRIQLKSNIHIFVGGEGPAADATDAPQPSALLFNPLMEIISFFSFFRVMEHRRDQITGKNDVRS